MGIDKVSGDLAAYQVTPPVMPKQQEAQTEAETGGDVAGKAVGKVNTAENTQVNPLGEQEEGFGAQGKDQKKEISAGAVSDISKKMLKNTKCVFGVHEKTNRITIRVMDKDTKEVVMELPPEKTLDMIAKAWELAGILMDEKL